ncbi:MAG: ABC transporter ATP-binding protein [Pseudomonadota bacterium]|nr:ABC transporter ATP-binding protein [Pseudomonadota bacterium]
MALLEIRNVVRRFGDFTAVDGVSLEVASGEFFTLLGPSGCGKTTLLRMIAGFDDPDQGDLLLDGKSLRDIPPEQRPIHTVFQSYALFPHLSVVENVAFPLRMAKVAPAEIQRRVQEALASVHLSEKQRHLPHELSGGQKQRVALARGLVNRPRLLLLDEPLGALDAKLREEMQVELINLQKNVGITFVFVTHSQAEALALSHRIAVMNQGKVEQLDEPSRLYGFPRNRFVADFIGKINMLAATVVASGSDHLELDVAGVGRVLGPPQPAMPVGTRGQFAVRPEQVRIGAGSVDSAGPLSNRVKGRILDFLYVGDVTTYLVELENGTRLEALLPNSAPGRAKFFETGDPVELAWSAEVGVFLDA